MAYPKLTETENATLVGGRCPDCNNPLLKGPEGGGSMNFLCAATATCGSVFNFSLDWERVSEPGPQRHKVPKGRVGNLICDPQDLLKKAGDLDKLSTMVERVTRQDLERAGRDLKSAAEDIGYLLSGRHKPVGCPCRLIQNDDNGTTYLIYEDACPVHRHLKHQLEAMKQRYEEAERKLQDTLRTQFAKAALAAAGTSVAVIPVEDVVKRAFQIADQMIAGLSRPS